jgi:hypothetical protein
MLHLGVRFDVIKVFIVLVGLRICLCGNVTSSEPIFYPLDDRQMNMVQWWIINDRVKSKL